MKEFKQNVFPRWRGFNLLGMFCSKNSPSNRGRAPGYFIEDDFKMISDLGFDFVRLPLSYRVWGNVENPFFVDEKKIEPLDKAVEFGSKYGLHINICMHRIPGYCINNDETELLDLWTSKEALDASVAQWSSIAKRYKDINSEKLSFNVVNEVNYYPTLVQYYKVSKQIINAVRKISPDRLFIIDGTHGGDIPPIDQMMSMDNCGYSCRGYAPRGLTHFKSHFKAYDGFEPTWPNAIQFECDGEASAWNRQKLDRMFGMYAALSNNFNVGVHCGELGCYKNTPHSVTLNWLRDTLESLKSFNIGWAMWNFRGEFGVMDSNRADVDYVDYCGHKLDKKMLNLLQKF